MKANTLFENWVMFLLEETRLTVTPRSLRLINFLNCCLQIIPRSHTSNIA